MTASVRTLALSGWLGKEERPVGFSMIILFFLCVLVPSCISEKALYESASGEKELPKWRILARAREEYGPYVKWKQALIKDLVDGSRIISTHKGPVEYSIHGGSGPYLMVIHGCPGGYDQTDALFGDMIGKGFRVLSWSRPGYLRTPIQNGKTFEEQADVAVALMDALRIRQASVLAYSAGGPVAIHMAAKYPDRLWGLVLECAVTQKWVISSENMREKVYFGYLMYSDPFLWTTDTTGDVFPRLIGKSTIEMESSLDKDEAKKLLDTIMQDPRRVKVLSDLTKSMSPAEIRKEGMENDVLQLEKVRDLPLKRIMTPTLIIHGTDDADVSPSDAKLAFETIPGSRLYLVQGGFHIMALTDDIDKVTGQRIAFLRDHAPKN